MSEFPHIAILIITYNRLATLQRTLEALRERLSYPADKLHIVVSDDSTGGGYIGKIKKLKVLKEWGASVTVLETSERSGWGRHVNQANAYIQDKIKPDYLFFCEDDYLLTKDIDLRVGVALLETKPDIGMLRYRGTAGTHVIFHQFEADITAYIPDYDENAGQSSGKLAYLQLDSGSPTLYLYSHGAHLKRMTKKGGYPAFHEHYLNYPEGLVLGWGEESYAHICKNRMVLPNAPAIAILPNFVSMAFIHIGESFQHSEHDIGRKPPTE